MFGLYQRLLQLSWEVPPMRTKPYSLPRPLRACTLAAGRFAACPGCCISCCVCRRNIEKKSRSSRNQRRLGAYHCHPHLHGAEFRKKSAAMLAVEGCPEIASVPSARTSRSDDSEAQ
ncbi:MAG: hypothetical protein ACLVEU_15390 [Bacteroides cellulosilyticus]